MKVAYITATHVPAASAQSLQIAAMAQAFGEVLQQHFLLISPVGKEQPVHSVSYRWCRIQTGMSWRPLRSAILLLRSLPHLRQFQAECIYTRDIGIAAVFYVIGFPVVYEIHKSFSTWIGRTLCRFLSRRMSMVAISAALKEYVVTTYHYPEDRVLVAHDGIATEWLTHSISAAERQAIRKQYFGVSDETPVILYTGSVGVGRGMGMILQAARSLPQYMMVCVGASQKDIAPYGEVPATVRIVPRQAQSVIADCLRAANVLIIPYTSDLPTYRFMSPLKLFEYMASGVPIVASRLGSMVEVAHDENTLLFDPGDQQAFEDALRRAVNDREAVEKRVLQATQDVQDMTWTNRVRKILAYISV